MKVVAATGTVLVHQMKRGERKIGSIIITNDDGDVRGIRPRWAKVYSVGEDVCDIKEGDWILIDHGRWSRGVAFLEDGTLVYPSSTEVFEEVFKVDYPTGVLAISEGEPDDTSFSAYI